MEELQAKIKTLESENMSKEHEISSLRHNNTNLEAEVEKLEGHVTKHKGELDRVGEAGSQNEALQRRLQLLEEEAEESDKNLRETNEKYAAPMTTIHRGFLADDRTTGYVRQTSKLDTTSARCRLWRTRKSNGSRSTRRWRRSTQPSRRSSRISRLRLATSEQSVSQHGFCRTVHCV